MSGYTPITNENNECVILTTVGRRNLEEHPEGWISQSLRFFESTNTEIRDVATNLGRVRGQSLMRDVIAYLSGSLL